jgi:tetratricopeptide (TPR) repeat protein
LFLAVSIPIGAYYLYQLFRWDIVWLRKWTETDLLRVKVPVYLLLIIFMSAAFVVFAGHLKLYKGPDKAAAYILKEGVPANIYSAAEWTGYMEYRLYPSYGVYGRNDISDNIPELAGQYNINSVLVPVKKAPSLMGTKFKPVYFDDESVLLVNDEKTDRYFEFIYPGEPVDFYDKKNPDKAMQELSDFYEKYPSTAVLVMLAHIHADKDPNEAIDFLQDASERNPGNRELKVLLGRLYYQEGQYENAIEAWGVYAFIDPELRVLANDSRKKIKRTE